jgi:hypothetical protein
MPALLYSEEKTQVSKQYLQNSFLADIGKALLQSSFPYFSHYVLNVSEKCCTKLDLIDSDDSTHPLLNRYLKKIIEGYASI